MSCDKIRFHFSIFNCTQSDVISPFIWNLWMSKSFLINIQNYRNIYHQAHFLGPQIVRRAHIILIWMRQILFNISDHFNVKNSKWTFIISENLMRNSRVSIFDKYASDRKCYLKIHDYFWIWLFIHAFEALDGDECCMWIAI